MRAQLSFEFMVYLTVSAAALAVMLGMFMQAQGPQAAIENRAYTEELVASIDANMEYAQSGFSAYLPATLCGATAENSTLETASGSFALNNPLDMSHNALCAGRGGIVRFNLTELYNGTFMLSR